MRTRLLFIALSFLIWDGSIHAQSFEGTYQLTVQKKESPLDYRLQLVEGEDGLIYGSLEALAPYVDYKRPIRLARQTKDSLYFSIWGRNEIKVVRKGSTYTGLARIIVQKSPT